MKLDLFLYKKAFWVFIAFFIFALWAFWPGYFSPVLGQEVVEPRYHTHGLAMTVWCVMLITQAYLIRINKRPLHKIIGRFSYVLMPFILLATFNLVHHLMIGTTEWRNIQLFNLALMVNAAVILAILYGLAIYHRKNPLLHARYMVCTIFPLFTPVTDRLIHHHFRSIIPMMPTIDAVPIVPLFGFIAADILLILLALWDWKAHRRKDAFIVSLVLLILYHISTVTFYRFEWWGRFGDWFVSLPLS